MATISEEEEMSTGTKATDLHPYLGGSKFSAWYLDKLLLIGAENTTPHHGSKEPCSK
jgi:hypothetical protein